MVDEVIDLIGDYRAGVIIRESDLEDRLKELDTESLAQFIRLMTEKGVFNNVL